MKDDSVVSTNSSYLIQVMSNLLPGLEPERINDLDLSNEDNLATLGTVEGLPDQHVCILTPSLF